MNETVLEVKNLKKNFGAFRAINDISFKISRGQVLGLLGPNGAGKTTTIHTLLGITLHNGGMISYFGKDFTKYREECLGRINFASAFNMMLGALTVFENLLVYAGLYGVKNPQNKIREFADYFEVGNLLSKRFWDISSGQKTRVNFVKALLNDPEILLLDEPTASLDPDIADKTLTLIERLKASRNLSILYTSHNMDEVTRLCDEVIFLDHGKIVAQDTPLGLTRRIKTATLLICFSGDRGKIERFLRMQGKIFSFKSSFTVEIKTPEQDIPSLIFSMSKLGVEITDIEIKKPTLEDVFLQIARE
jgi:ABC-2 type transport system ATP-binding protein